MDNKFDVLKEKIKTLAVALQKTGQEVTADRIVDDFISIVQEAIDNLDKGEE